MSNRQKSQTGTLVQGKADPLVKPGIGGRGTGVGEKQGSRKKEEPSPFQALIEEYLSSQSFSAKTKDAYKGRLALFAAFLGGGDFHPREITKAHINEYAASLEDKSDSTRAAYLTTLRRFFDWQVDRNLLLVNPALHLSIPRPSTLVPLPLTEREAVRLLNAPDTDTVLGLRDRAMLEVLYATGMRAKELTGLTLTDLDLAERHCFIQKGKGGRGRWAPLTHEACVFLQAYLDASRPRLVRGRIPSALFLGMRGRPLERYGVWTICRRNAEKAGIERRVWPHLLRHTAACHLLENGASLFHVQLLLGHALPTTTQRYTHVTLGRLRETLKACHPRA